MMPIHSWKTFIIASLLALHSFNAFAIPQNGMNDEETKLAQMINQLREQLGIQPLDHHPALQNAARKHSYWMAEQDRELQDGDQLSHYGPGPNDTIVNRARDTEGYPFRRIGENIACGFGDAKRTFLQWAYSPNHLKNMIDPRFHEMGLAREGTGKEECPYYWTNDLGSRILPGSAITEPDRSKIKTAIEWVIQNLPASFEKSRTSK